MSTKVPAKILIVIGAIVAVVGFAGAIYFWNETSDYAMNFYNGDKVAHKAYLMNGIMDMLGIIMAPGIAMVVGGIIMIKRVNKKRTTLPDIRDKLNPGEQVLKSWPSTMKTGFLSKKYVMLTLTNRRVMTVDTDSRKILTDLNLEGITAVVSNRHTVASGTIYYNGYNNLSSREYGDISFFKDGQQVYGLMNIPDADGVVSVLAQARDRIKE